jgi:hypothetical protein
MKRLCTWVLGAAALAAVQGCSDEPTLYLGGPPGAAATLEFSKSAVTMAIGDSSIVGVRAEDAAGNPTADAVTLSACDALVGVGSQSSSSQWTTTAFLKGAGLGASCVLAQAAGVSDTIRVTVGPAGVKIFGPDTVVSGLTGDYTLVPVDYAGNPLTGTVSYTWSTSTKARLAIDAANGLARGRTPGAVDVRLVAPGGANAKKAVIVIPGVFAGTLSATSAAPGELITATRAADGPTFDADQQVTLGSTAAFVDTVLPNSVVFAVPATGSTALATLTLANIGPEQLAQATSFTSTMTTADVYQPGNITNDCSDPSAAPDFTAVKSSTGWVYFAHNGTALGTRGCQNSGAVTGYDHYFIYTTGASAEVIDVEARWTLTGDNDIIICATDYSDCPGVGFSGGTLAELDAVDVPLLANTSYFIIYSPWTGNAGTNQIRVKVTSQ